MIPSDFKLDISDIDVEYIAPHLMSGTKRTTFMIALVKGAKSRRRLLGEAFASSVYQPVIQFKVFDDDSVESLFNKFLQQLVHRGYQPVQYRMRDLNGRLTEWKPVDLTNIDQTDLDRGGVPARH